MNELLTQIGNYGFPMVVAVFLLVRIEKKLDEITVAIARLGDNQRSMAVFHQPGRIEEQWYLEISRVRPSGALPFSGLG